MYVNYKNNLKFISLFTKKIFDGKFQFKKNMFVIIVPCDVENDCHINANCEWVESETRNKCVCIPGYEGNGYDCVERDISCLIDVCR